MSFPTKYKKLAQNLLLVIKNNILRYLHDGLQFRVSLTRLRQIRCAVSVLGLFELEQVSEPIFSKVEVIVRYGT